MKLFLRLVVKQEVLMYAEETPCGGWSSNIQPSIRFRLSLSGSWGYRVAFVKKYFWKKHSGFCCCHIVTRFNAVTWRVHQSDQSHVKSESIHASRIYVRAQRVVKQQRHVKRRRSGMWDGVFVHAAAEFWTWMLNLCARNLIPPMKWNYLLRLCFCSCIHIDINTIP